LRFLALPNILPAAAGGFWGEGRWILREFVDLYVHLRHPHHYDPMVGRWRCGFRFFGRFRWRFGGGGGGARMEDGRMEDGLKRAGLVFGFFFVLQIIALIFAGVFFVSESLVQMSLFRFSVYAKVLSCIGAAGVLMGGEWVRRQAARVVLTFFAGDFADCF